LQNDGLIIKRTILIPAPIDRVWQFLMTEENMKNWFNADEFEIDIIEGGKVEIPLIIEGEKVWIEGEIGLILPEEKFAFTWLERDILGDAWFNNTTVTIGLKKTGKQTLITIEHDGFKYLPDEDRVTEYQKYSSFWDRDGMLQRLHSLITGQ
jgi:uncharacterized protein YndB with AHSA1/START domain